MTVNYTSVNPAWGIKHYTGREFAELWMSREHLGNRALATQHLLGLPYFKYVGNSSHDDASGHNSEEAEVNEIIVTWQILASHARRAPVNAPQADVEKLEYGNPMSPVESETSDHRSFMEHRFVKISPNAGVDGEEIHSHGKEEEKKVWKIASITPSVLYGTGDFMRVRRNEGLP